MKKIYILNFFLVVALVSVFVLGAYFISLPKRTMTGTFVDVSTALEESL